MGSELPENFRETAHLDKLIEVKTNSDKPEELLHEPVDLAVVSVQLITISYHTKPQTTDHYLLRDDPHSRVRDGLYGISVNPGIPKDATHYSLGNLYKWMSDLHDFVPVAFFKEKS